jgi:putative membrane protein
MWGYGPYGMMGYGGGWMMLIGGIFWVSLLALIILGIIRLARGPEHGAHAAKPVGRSPGLDILDERYAKGEIQREEFLQKKNDLQP